MIAIDLSKQQALDADPKAVQEIDLNGNLDQADGVWMVIIFEEVKKTI